MMRLTWDGVYPVALAISFWLAQGRSRTQRRNSIMAAMKKPHAVMAVPRKRHGASTVTP